jgi:hypothetical protein
MSPTAWEEGTTIMASEQTEPALREALKRSAAALKADGVPFALGGGYALWVHGAPEPDHDVDLVVAETAVEDAVRSLGAAGFRIERPPEDWLFKAYLDDAADADDGDPPLVDVLHRLAGVSVTEESLASAEESELLGIRIPVQPPTPIMIAKLQSLSEHYSDFGALLPVVRAVREQLDWAELRAATADQPFAEAFLLLCDRLEIAPP